VIAPAAGRTAELEIAGLGSAGDGVAHHEGRLLHVPLALPGERWRVRISQGRAAAPRVETVACLRGVARPPPVCPHFGVCGGCRLQHLEAEPYTAFKQRQVAEALRRVGLQWAIEPPLASPLGSRRRIRLAIEARAGRIALGYRARRSRSVVPVARCPIAMPALEGLLPHLATLLQALACASRGGEVVLSWTDAGLDLALELPLTPGLADRERLVSFAERHDLARVALLNDGWSEPVLVRRTPAVRLGRWRVEHPSGGFLQATLEGEAALQQALAEAVPERARLLDLFAGIGTLSLPIADRLGSLELVEGDAAAVDALGRALRGAPRLKVTRRDLARDPLEPRELAKADMAVLDPPRAGALEQVGRIAQSPLARLVYVSCNPATFARDARVLADAGFTASRIRPVDQFLFSTEIELVAVLERPARPTMRAFRGGQQKGW
jgi:23S rRNA (uracil1939-C5)-methyltransferase